MQQRVMCNDQGRRIGESHPQARLTDGDVMLVLDLRETTGMPYSQIARKFDVSRGCIAKICLGYRRGQAATIIREVRAC